MHCNAVVLVSIVRPVAATPNSKRYLRSAHAAGSKRICMQAMHE